MNSISMGIFVKKKDVAPIWDQNELPSRKGSWEIDEIGAIYNAVIAINLWNIAALRHEKVLSPAQL